MYPLQESLLETENVSYTLPMRSHDVATTVPKQALGAKMGGSVSDMSPLYSKTKTCQARFKCSPLLRMRRQSQYCGRTSLLLLWITPSAACSKRHHCCQHKHQLLPFAGPERHQQCEQPTFVAPQRHQHRDQPALRHSSTMNLKVKESTWFRLEY